MGILVYSEIQIKSEKIGPARTPRTTFHPTALCYFPIFLRFFLYFLFFSHVIPIFPYFSPIYSYFSRIFLLFLSYLKVEEK